MKSVSLPLTWSSSGSYAIRTDSTGCVDSTLVLGSRCGARAPQQRRQDGSVHGVKCIAFAGAEMPAESNDGCAWVLRVIANQAQGIHGVESPRCLRQGQGVPAAEAVAGQVCPGELDVGIDLARRRYIGVADD